MNFKPVSYDSLKTIIQHFEPNFRFRLADRIPSIQTAEKRTPLFITDIYLEPARLTIGDTEYSIKCTMKNPNILFKGMEAKTLERCRKGRSYDLNRFGFCDWFAEDVMHPGDIRIEDVDEEEVRETETRSKQLQLLLDRFIDEEMEQPVSYLHLTIESSRGTYTEHLSHDRSVPEAMKYLTTKLLGGRRHVLKCRNISFSESGILRLPFNLKMKIQSIRVTHNCGAVFDALSNLIVDDSFPLEYVVIDEGDVFNQSNNYNHPWIQSAEYVEIKSDSEDLDWLDAVLGIKVPHAHFECEVRKDDIQIVINNWIDNGKNVGTDFSFGIEKTDDVREILEGCMSRPGATVERVIMQGCPLFPEIIFFPLDKSSELCIYCHENDEDDCEIYKRWELNLVVTVPRHREFWNIDFELDELFN